MCMSSYSRLDCTLVGGPKDEVITTLACLDREGTAPCDTKEYLIDYEGGDPYIAVYRLKRMADGVWEVDPSGRAVLYYEETSHGL